MTDDRDFKRLVRATASETGDRYSTVRARLTAEPPGAPPADAIASAYEALLERLRTAYFGSDEMLQQFTIATIAGGDILFAATSGVGRTSLVAALAAAVGASPIVIDGTSDPATDDLAEASEVVLVSDVECTSARFRSRLRDAMIGLDRLVIASHAPAVDLATAGGDLFDAFMASFELPVPGREAEERVLRVAREGSAWAGKPALLSWTEFRALPAACNAIDMPDSVTAHILDLVESARHRGDGARVSPRASISLAKLGAAVAGAAGRSAATIDDVDRIAPAVLGHRIATT